MTSAAKTDLGAAGLLASIGLIGNAQVRYLMMDVARQLRRKHNAVIHLYCVGPQSVEFYKRENIDGVLASINDCDTLYPSAQQSELDASEVIARARGYERKIGCTNNFLMVGDRHFGRGYALGGYYHPRSRPSEASYIQILHAYNETFSFWEQEIRDKGLTLILGGNSVHARIFRAEGVPVRMLAGSRFQNLHHWVDNEFREYPAIEAAFGPAGNGRETRAEISETYYLEQAHRQRFLHGRSFPRLLYRLGHATTQWLYWRARGYAKAKGYKFTDRLAFQIRKWRDTRRMTKRTMTRLDELGDAPFVFFALHTEPEASLGQFSPEYFYQLAAIAALSRDLPAGIWLVVKETIHGVGRRPDNFYDQIAEFKNVVMLDILEHGIEVVRRASAVATIAGTVGFEAAVMGKPVITFDRHNFYNFLPHVFPVTDETELKDVVATVLGESFNSEHARASGAAFLQAVKDTSFDLRGYDYVDLHSYDELAVDNACCALLESLEGERMSATSTARSA